MRLIKGNKIIKASPKAYKLLYKGRGYVPYIPPEITAQAEDEPSVSINNSKDMTKAEIGEILTARGIDFNPRDKKDKLLELLMAGD